MCGNVYIDNCMLITYLDNMRQLTMVNVILMHLMQYLKILTLLHEMPSPSELLIIKKLTNTEEKR